MLFIKNTTKLKLIKRSSFIKNCIGIIGILMLLMKPCCYLINVVTEDEISVIDFFGEEDTEETEEQEELDKKEFKLLLTFVQSNLISKISNTQYFNISTLYQTVYKDILIPPPDLA